MHHILCCERSMKIIPLFPSLVWECEIEVPEDMVEYCLSMPQKSGGVKYSNRGGWHSESYLHEDSTFVKKYLNYFTNELNFLPKFKVDHCWININYNGSYNISHCHPGSDLSLVWYIQTPNQCGDIEFENPNCFSRSNLNETIDLEVQEQYFQYDEHQLPSIKNKCYVFPSDLRHLVEENKSNIERISMSANLSFTC
jgi:uncharacterized protein (TIGR02466 family)